MNKKQRLKVLRQRRHNRRRKKRAKQRRVAAYRQRKDEREKVKKFVTLADLVREEVAGE